MALASGSIVEEFDVIEHVCPSIFPISIDTPLDAFCFQGVKEALRDGVIVEVALELATARKNTREERMKMNRAAGWVCTGEPDSRA